MTTAPLDVLYGVVGEGMGHATRSRVVLEHLLSAGHRVRVVVSGRAHRFLVDEFAGRDRIDVEQIEGLHLDYRGNAVDLAETIRRNLERSVGRLARNVEVYRKVAEDGFRPAVVISDFESWAFLYGRIHDIPVVSIDNMQILNRCHHDGRVTDGRRFDFQVAKYAVKAKLPGAYHYLVTSFFFPPVRKKRTTLVGPILRPDIRAARRAPADHLVAYFRAGALESILPVLRATGVPCRVYGSGREGEEGNVVLRPFSPTEFVDDLRTARAVVAGAGFSLMGEAVHIGVPMLAVPIEGQFEQELNARYLADLGYGAWAPSVDDAVLGAFLDRTETYESALAGFRRTDDRILFDLVDELLARIAAGEPAPVRLSRPACGKFDESVATFGDEDSVSD